MKVDWEKANRAEKVRSRQRPNRYVRRDDVQAALAQFVRMHRISCFKCGSKQAEWAKTGFSKRGPWVICKGCIDKR